jgi:hypothetical protein
MVKESREAYIIKINQLTHVNVYYTPPISRIIPNHQDKICNAVDDQDVAMFMG